MIWKKYEMLLVLQKRQATSAVYQTENLTCLLLFQRYMPCIYAPYPLWLRSPLSWQRVGTQALFTFSSFAMPFFRELSLMSSELTKNIPVGHPEQLGISYTSFPSSKLPD